MHEKKGKQLHHVWSRAFWDVVHGSEMVDCKDVETLNMETQTYKDFLHLKIWVTLYIRWP